MTLKIKIREKREIFSFHGFSSSGKHYTRSVLSIFDREREISSISRSCRVWNENGEMSVIKFFILTWDI